MKENSLLNKKSLVKEAQTESINLLNSLQQKAFKGEMV